METHVKRVEEEASHGPCLRATPRWWRRSIRYVALAMLILLAGFYSYSSYRAYTNQIAVIEINGPIDGFVETTSQLRMARDDPYVKAVVIRINSPGGGVEPTKEIMKYIISVKESGKPVVVTMEEFCTSGAYLLSVPSNYIFAYSNTVTGSLGAIAVWVDRSGELDEDKIKVWVWKTGPYKDMGAFWRSPTEEEQKLIDNYIKKIYNYIVDTIARYRNLDAEIVKKYATGATFNGNFAVSYGFVDEIGDYRDAVRKAAELAGIEEEYITTKPQEGVHLKIGKATLAPLVGNPTTW